MKLILKALSVVSVILLPSISLAQTCPFGEASPQPSWVSDTELKQEMVSAVGVEQYDSSVHSDFFALRKQSEVRARKALAQRLSASIYHSILSNKTLSHGQLVKKGQSVVEQVTELTMPDSRITDRWLDKDNCLLWSKIEVGNDIVAEYVDEISEMEQEVNDTLEVSITKSVVETLNAKQFYLNYDGFSKALDQQAMLTFQGVSKPALTWMIDSGFDVLEPSFVRSYLLSDGMALPYNTSSIETYMAEKDLTAEKMAYIVRAFKKSQYSIYDLRTPIIQHEGSKNIFMDRNSGIDFLQEQGNKLDAAFALELRFSKEQPYWDYPKVTNVYENRKTLATGDLSLLHIMTIFQRTELIRVLLDEGFDPNVEDINGMTPAQYAVAFENESITKLYLDNSKSLKGVYLIAVKKAIYTSNKYLYLMSYDKGTIDIMTTNTGVDYEGKFLKKYKKAFKRKDPSNVKAAQKLIKQSVHALNVFWKSDKYHGANRSLTKNYSDRNIKRLTDLI
ncbi:ankyrin repeat domain-containing protein [Vibrio tapetis subsp. quintayensis]|uniref:ankyrin repeat domain-containing protein n=1 Tax=Vibrio tapetis TaxID=52443 RepID=UPI0025B620CF|nr:ankyrin repeat domain-containing protein [Vibrio tapetis]MDN3683084.1 ankyrin repeat domain-containing protein [Vibrio tapetis subsp. quintayensis]